MIILIRLIPFIIFLFPTILAYRQKNYIALVICGLYLISAFSTLFMGSDIIPFHDFDNESFFIFLLYSVLIVPFLYLSLKIKPITNKDILPNGFIFNNLLIVFAIGAIYSLAYLTPYALISLATDASEIRQLISRESILPPTFLTTIAVGFPTFYFLYSFLMFVCIIQKRSKVLIFCMFLGVIAFVVNVLTVSGRDGVLFAAFAFLLSFFIFKPLLSDKQIKRIKIGFILLMSFGLTIIGKITAERFSEGDGLDFNSFRTGILGYIGTQPYIFAEWITENKIFNYGNNVFAVFKDLVGLDTSVVYEYSEQYTWMFGTFLASFYSISGFSSLIIITFLFWLFFKVKFKIFKTTSLLSSFFLMGLYFDFTLSGIFYFRLANRGGNLYIIISLLAIYLLRNSKNKLLTKNSKFKDFYKLQKKQS